MHLVLVPIEILSEQGFQDGCDMLLVRRFKNEVGGASRVITDDQHRHLRGRQATLLRSTTPLARRAIQPLALSLVRPQEVGFIGLGNPRKRLAL